MNVFPKEKRILAWKKIPESSRILLIASIIVIIFLTLNLAEEGPSEIIEKPKTDRLKEFFSAMDEG